MKIFPTCGEQLNFTFIFPLASDLSKWYRLKMFDRCLVCHAKHFPQWNERNALKGVYLCILAVIVGRVKTNEPEVTDFELR